MDYQNPPRKGAVGGGEGHIGFKSYTWGGAKDFRGVEIDAFD